MKKVLLVSIASFVLFSCELFEQPYSTSRVDNEKNISYSKSKDDALNELCSFLGVTKSDMEINSIEVIYGSGLTKSGNSDSLLFLINLNSGYAVIAADKRIPENILMFSENGEATPEMFYGQPVPIDSVTTYNNNYYNSTYDDYYVGSEPAHPESFIMEMVYQYAQAAVTTHNGIYGEYDTPDDSLRLIDGTTLDVYPIRKNIRTYTVTKVNSMMNTLWMQSDPYNSYVPMINQLDACLLQSPKS